METFDPVDYSLAENNFFLKHLGESPVVAMQEALPSGVSQAAVRDVLGAVYELDELKKHRGKEWTGVDTLATAIRVYLHEWEKWRKLANQGAPRWPTLHAWDGKGRPHRGGIGSASANIVTYLSRHGEGGWTSPEIMVFVVEAIKRRVPILAETATYRDWSLKWADIRS